MNHILDHFKYCPHCGSSSFKINNIKSKKCSDCGFVYYLNPSAACAAFIRDKFGRLLLAIRAVEPAKGTYDLPGGFSDLNETSEESILREIAEEVSPNIVEESQKTLKFLFSIPNMYCYSGMDIPTMDMFYELTVEDLTKYIGKGQDDVKELIAINPEDLEIDKFGLKSIKQAVTKYLFEIGK